MALPGAAAYPQSMKVGTPVLPAVRGPVVLRARAGSWAMQRAGPIPYKMRVGRPGESALPTPTARIL